ncbi:transposase family protein [Streptomyces chartreusis]|uniref:transposase family protein n=1 Tax=Streptomyces chartreusis TaxID=1969 RepID=UPI0036942C9F
MSPTSPRPLPAVSCWSTAPWCPPGTGQASAPRCSPGSIATPASTARSPPLSPDTYGRSPLPSPGSRHDTYAWRQSHFPKAFTERDSMGDLDYVGTGMFTARRKPPGQEQYKADKVFNQSINTLRAAVERAIAHLKDWKSSPPATTAPFPLPPRHQNHHRPHLLHERLVNTPVNKPPAMMLRRARSSRQVNGASRTP